MSTDLEQQIAGLAAWWDDLAPTISLAEITGRRSATLELDVALIDRPAADVTIDVDTHARRHDRRRPIAIAAAALVVVCGAVALSRRSSDGPDPVSSVSTAPATSTAEPAPTSSTTSEPQPAPEPALTPTPTTALTEPTPLSPDEVAERLAAIDAERREALRGFTTLGFTVNRAQMLPDGSAYENGPSMTPARVVMRNDGSVSVTAGSFGTSYYDAVSGTVQVVYSGADGLPLYQQIDGAADSSTALGVPTGLANGIVTPLPSLNSGVVAIEEDSVGGRSTWRIEQRHETGFGEGNDISTTVTWIDRATGVTLKTVTDGAGFIDNGGDLTPIKDTIWLSELTLDEAIPADFPTLIPPNVNVDRSGDALAFGPITVDAAAAEIGPGAVVPTIEADQVSIQRMAFGTADGGTETSPSLIVRWFDGFVRTELRVTRLPSSMPAATSCPDCTGSLLEQLSIAPITEEGVSVGVGQIQVSITGDPERIRTVIDSLVAVD